MEEISLDFTFPAIDRLSDGTIEHLGYPGPQAAAGRVKDSVYRAIETCRELADVKALCRATSFTRLDRKTIYGNGVCLATVNWARLAARMSGIEEFFCFALTLGEKIDREIKRLEGDEMLEALVLDAAASTLAEIYADQAQMIIERSCREQGLSASARFSPGYCDWPLADGQRSLFPFLQPESIGVSLSDSCLMTPRKTITAVIIAARQMPAKTPCFMCARECPHRRAPFENPGGQY